jgi:putative redox protein
MPDNMETSHIKYLGDLRTQAIHLHSGSELITDAPLDNNGKAEAFSPTDLVATALGSCMLTIMGIAARTHGFPLEGTLVHITKIMNSEPRRIGEIIVELEFPNHSYTEKEKKIIEHAAFNCPVAKSLHSDIKQTICFNYK